jgi:replicative DNA helicase
MSTKQIEQIEALAEQIEQNWPLYIDDRKGLTTEQIIATIRRYARRGVKVFLLDYLQRVCFETARGENRATAIQDACGQLADAAKKYDVALLVLSQLANKAESQKKRPTGKDFKESGGIAEACDCAIILHNVDRVEGNHTKKKRTCKFEIVVDFQRVGQSGRKVTCRHDLSTAHFYEHNESLPLETLKTT